MKKDMLVVEKILNHNQERIQFFMQKLKKDLKNYSFELEETELEKLLMDAAAAYSIEDIVPFYFFSSAFIKRKLNKEKKNVSESNSFFSDLEMNILNKYLLKTDGKYLSAEEIADNLSLSILTVTSAVQRLRSYLNEQPILMKQLFSDLKRISYVENKPSNYEVKKYTKIVSLTPSEIELLGYFTGQIDDICVDIDDLAVEFNDNSASITNQLRRIYSALKTKQNFDLVLSKYPNIEPLLSIRENIIKLPSKSSSAKKEDKPKFQKEKKAKPRSRIDDIYFLKTLYTKKDDGSYYTFAELASELNLMYSSFITKKSLIHKKLKKDPSFKAKVLLQYPDFFEEQNEYNDFKQSQKNPQMNLSNPQENNKMNIRKAEFLFQLYQKKEDGTYYSLHELAELQHVRYNNFMAKRKKLLLEFEENESFRKMVLQLYPTLLMDKISFDESIIPPPYTLTSKMSEQRDQQKIEFLHYLFQKKDDDTYYTSKEQIVRPGMIDGKGKQFTYGNFMAKRKSVMKKIEEDEMFRKMALEIYPDIMDEKGKYEHAKTQYIPKENIHSKNKKVSQERKIEFIHQLYQKKEDGSYYSPKEQLSREEMLGKNSEPMSYSAFICKRRRILKQFEEDNFFRENVLEKYPDIMEAKEQYDSEKDKQISTDEIIVREKSNSLQKQIEFIHQLYQKKEDGTYYSFEELADNLEIKHSSFYKIKDNIFKMFKQNENFRQAVVNSYPEVLEEIEKYYSSQNHCENLTKTEEAVINTLYSDETKKVDSYRAIASSLKISPSAFFLLRNSVIEKVKNNPHIQEQHPNAMDEYYIRESFFKGNSITISEQELLKIRKNSRYYDIPKAKEQDKKKSPLLQGIHSLEEFEYKDYVALCTTEQKAMLALRLGFFNQTIFSTTDVAEVFRTGEDEVSLLTKECLKSKQEIDTTKKEFKKIIS